MRAYSLSLRKSIYHYANSPENRGRKLREIAAVFGVSISYVWLIRQDSELA